MFMHDLFSLNKIFQFVNDQVVLGYLSGQRGGICDYESRNSGSVTRSADLI